MEKILEVKNLSIAFRTSSGTLKAVRDISFDLEKGKTLAIVGESGSGKSVTSRAIMGILAGNAIVEGGEIFFDGKDLLRIPEEEMQHIRGDKISMIFQDPLSSLNPIVKIGKQITEAMLLKGKASRREARREFKRLLGEIRKKTVEATGAEKRRHVEGMFQTFRSLVNEGNRIENQYNDAYASIQDAQAQMGDFLFLREKNRKTDDAGLLRTVTAQLKRARNPYLTGAHDQELDALLQETKGALNTDDYAAAVRALNDKLDELARQPRPNFMALGYARTKGADVPMDKAEDMLQDEFMSEFLPLLDQAVQLSHDQSVEKKQALLPVLEKAAATYEGEFKRRPAKRLARSVTKQVKGSIDRLDVHKDSAAYAFGTSVQGAIDRYFEIKKRNPREEKRFARQSARRAAKIARGRSVSWKVIPANIYDLDELHANVSKVPKRLIQHTEESLNDQIDVRARSEALVAALQRNSSDMVSKVTKSMAKEKAIKLMEEVGIHEPRQRFYQYPFEFSGGMRQRIVIAIALVANPDILICDEPTTALDVTIQAQILELINKLKAERNLTVIFITHDLGVVANMADDIAVMYAGKIVEFGTADDIFYDPQHPYTWELLSSMPDLDTKERLESIPGTPPNMIYPPAGDAFADRNRYAMKIDYEQQPPMFKVSDTHSAATWLLHPDAPKVEMPKIISDRIARLKAKEALELQAESGQQEGGEPNG